ncbi:phosphoribosyltransferase [Pseudomonas schmalbachii]|uniref:Phosphoribosyltransferase n=1 Tax=Pseudomonas schmalbachii TaxID=2816993 RepID=A0ABS3TJS0_9PSED|nr:phosphoribosyltransferase [Pseudomonas schmalbachii]MBO3273638.1 phosphoribosyltransferase [Pseudomonas schmalbachii]
MFANRRQAGIALAEVLQKLHLPDPVVLALPRGGVPVADEVARALNAPLDLLLVRKIGAPGQEELAVGAVVGGEHPQWIRDDNLLRHFSVPPDWFEAQVQRQLAEIERRRRLYLGSREPVPLAGRDVIVVDDGLATGSTARVALQSLASAGARKLILAVPVGPPDTVAALRPLVDELVCLITPDFFAAVGQYYLDFTQTEDREVVELLANRR